MGILKIIPDWALGIGFIITIVIIVIGLLILLYKRVINVKTKWFSVDSIDPKILVLIFKESIRVDRKISRIEYIERMREQMSFVDDKIKEIKSIIIKVHRHILQAKGISKSESENHIQIRILNEISENMLNQMKTVIRERFKEMNELFNSKDNINDEFNYIKAEFQVYFDRVVKALLQDCRDNMRERWVNHEEIIIARRESWDSIQESISKNGEIGIILKEIFINAIEIQLKCSKEIKELESQVDKLINEPVNKDKK